eukprot:tig00000179_g13065.t1
MSSPLTDAGPAVALPQLQRIFGSGPPAEAEEARKQLTGPHGLASRPISGPQTDALILLWEMLRIVEELASLCWEGSESTNLRDCYRDLTSAIERRLPEDFERCDVKVLHVDGARFFAFKVKRIEVPELSPWYCPIASIAECIYGNPRNTVSENLGSARSWSFLSSRDGAAHRQAPDRDPAFALAFKRASLAVRGMDPAEIDLMVPEPQPARRLAIFSREEWLTARRPHPSPRSAAPAPAPCRARTRRPTPALTSRRAAGQHDGQRDDPPAAPHEAQRAHKGAVPASIDTVVSLLRRYAGMSEEKRKRRNLWHAVNGGLSYALRCRYFDSLGAPPDPRLKRAATKALPTFAWVTELPERLQVDGHSCGIWALWFGESVALEAATQYSWHEYLNDGSIGFLKSGEADKGGRKAYRTLLESAIVDTSDLRLFEIDEDVDSWAVALPASSRAPGRSRRRPPPRPPRLLVLQLGVQRERGRGRRGGERGRERRRLLRRRRAPLTPIDRAASPPFAGSPRRPCRWRWPCRRPPRPRRRRRVAAAVRLSEGEFGRALRHQMAAYREWRQAPLNASRKGNAIENSSLQNDLGIIQRLLGYVRMREGLEGELTLDVMGRLDAVEIVLRFFRFLREERGTKPARSPAEPAEPAPRRVQDGEEVAAADELRRVRARPPGRADAYEAFDAEEKPRQKAKHLRDCLLLGFLSISPARPGLLQHLKIGDTLRKDNGRWNMSILSMRIQDGPSEGPSPQDGGAREEGVPPRPPRRRWARRSGTGPWSCRKTCRAARQEPLTEYVENYRRHLLREGAKDQGYIFFTSAGEPFRRGSWTAFAKEAFCRWTGVPVPPRTMRAVVTTWHTPKTATMHYDCHRTQREVRRPRPARPVAARCAPRASDAPPRRRAPRWRGWSAPPPSTRDRRSGRWRGGAAALEGAKRAERAGTDDEEEEEEEEEEEGTEDEKGSESGGEDQDAAGEARGGAPGGGGGGGGSDEGEDGGSSDESSDEPKEGMRVERELARAEGRWEEVEEAEGSGGGRQVTAKPPPGASRPVPIVLPPRGPRKAREARRPASLPHTVTSAALPGG